MPTRPASPVEDPPLTPVVFHILLALTDEPLHGYAIMQAVEESGGEAVATGPGTLYGALQRLQEMAFLRSQGTATTSRRKKFALTARGRKALRSESQRLLQLAEIVRRKKLAEAR